MAKCRWHPVTGEMQIFADDESAPDDWLDYHPADTEKSGASAPAESSPKSAPASKNAPPPPVNEKGERLDGPTVAEFVAAGYAASLYPPKGYASRSTDAEIAAAIAAEGKK